MKSWLMGLLIGAGVTTVAGGLLAIAFVAGRERDPFPASPAGWETGPASTIPEDRPAPARDLAPWDLEDKGRGVRETVRVFEGTSGLRRPSQNYPNELPCLTLAHPGGKWLAFCAFRDESKIPYIRAGSYVKIRGRVATYQPEQRLVHLEDCELLELQQGTRPESDYEVPLPLPIPPRGR